MTAALPALPGYRSTTRTSTCRAPRRCKEHRPFTAIPGFESPWGRPLNSCYGQPIVELEFLRGEGGRIARAAAAPWQHQRLAEAVLTSRTRQSGDIATRCASEPTSAPRKRSCSPYSTCSSARRGEAGSSVSAREVFDHQGTTQW